MYVDITVLYQQFFRYRYSAVRLAGLSVFSVGIFVLYVLAGTSFEDFAGTLFLKNSLFFFKRRAKCTKRGPKPPLLRKKGAPANFLRGSRQNFDTECTDQDILWYWYW